MRESPSLRRLPVDPRPPHRPRRAPLAALAVAALAAACDVQFGPPEGDDEVQASAPERERTRVRVAEVEAREMVFAIETHTVVESERQIQVFPRDVGVVMEVLVEEGDSVAAGQALARLDRRERELAVDEAAVAADEARATIDQLELVAKETEARVAALRRTFEQAERDHARNERIAATGGEGPALISDKDLDASRLARDSARGELEQALLALERARVEQTSARTAIDRADLAKKQAEVALSHTELVAPFDGVIAERTVELGDMASTSTPAFVLTDPFHLRVRFYRPQRELGLFTLDPADAASASAPDLAIEATAEAFPGRTFRGTIQRVAPTIDSEAGAFRVTASLDRTAVDDSSAVLLPGMLVRLRIVTDRHPDALVVPKRAVRREGDATLVFAVEDGLARRVEVREGFTTDEDVEVIVADGSRLAPGDRVVVVGNRDLEDGAEVEIEGPRTPPAAATAASEGASPAEGDAGQDADEPARAAEAAGESEDEADGPEAEVAGG